MAPAFVGNGYLAGRQPFDGQGFAEITPPARPTRCRRSRRSTGSTRSPYRTRRPAPLHNPGSSGGRRCPPGRRSRRTTEAVPTGSRAARCRTTGRASTSAPAPSPRRCSGAPRPARRSSCATTSRPTGRAGTRPRSGCGSSPVQREGDGHRHLHREVRGVPKRTARATTAALPQLLLTAARRSPGTCARNTYTFTKYVGIATSSDSRAPPRAGVVCVPTRGPPRLPRPAPRLRRGVGQAVALRHRRVRRPAAPAPGAVVVLRAAGERQAGHAVNASPGGLSSDGYNGHVFWDSETWMYPSLLATEPPLARPSLEYRYDRLGAARANARETGGKGARFPQENALRGTEETPAFAKPASSRSTSTPTSPWPSTSTGWPRATDTGGPPPAGPSSAGSRSTTSASPPSRRWQLQHPRRDPTRRVRRGRGRQRLHQHVGRGHAPVRRRSRTHPAPPADPRWSRVARGLRILFDGPGHPPRVRRVPR